MQINKTKIIILILFFFSGLIFFYPQLNKFNSNNELPAIIFFLTLLYFIFRYDFSYENPAVFNIIYWSLIIIFLTVFGSTHFSIISGIWYIYFITLTFSLGFFFYKKKNRLNLNKKKRNISNLNIVYLLYSASLLISFFSLYILLRSVNYDFLDLLSFSKLKELSRLFSDIKYNNSIPQYTSGIYFSISFSFCYLVIILGTFLFVYKSFSRKFFLLEIISFLPIFFYAFVKNQRAAILFGILVAFSTLISTKIYLRKKNKINLNNLVNYLSIFFIVILCYFQLQKIRVIGISEENLLQYFESAVSGSYFAFLNWFNKYILYQDNITLGEYTINRLHYYTIGNSPNSPGLFGDVFWMADNFRSGTTIYTIFRSLISDFGVAGSFLIYFLFGYLSSFFYNNLKDGNILYLPLISLTFFIISFSYLTSVLNWNSIILAYLIATIIFATISYKQNE